MSDAGFLGTCVSIAPHTSWRCGASGLFNCSHFRDGGGGFRRWKVGGLPEGCGPEADLWPPGPRELVEGHVVELWAGGRPFGMVGGEAAASCALAASSSPPAAPRHPARPTLPSSASRPLLLAQSMLSRGMQQLDGRRARDLPADEELQEEELWDHAPVEDDAKGEQEDEDRTTREADNDAEDGSDIDGTLGELEADFKLSKSEQDSR